MYNLSWKTLTFLIMSTLKLTIYWFRDLFRCALLLRVLCVRGTLVIRSLTFSLCKFAWVMLWTATMTLFTVKDLRYIFDWTQLAVIYQIRVYIYILHVISEGLSKTISVMYNTVCYLWHSLCYCRNKSTNPGH